MYALKKITVTADGRQVEECHILGNWYRLEQHHNGALPDIVALVEHADEKGNTPVISIHKMDEVYITLLTGETVRRVCRGDAEARQQLVKDRVADTAQQPLQSPPTGGLDNKFPAAPQRQHPISLSEKIKTVAELAAIAASRTPMLRM